VPTLKQFIQTREPGHHTALLQSGGQGRAEGGDRMSISVRL
jgi:hypothetical protein